MTDFIVIFVFLGLPLLLTIIIEGIAAFFCKIRSFKDQCKIMLINVATNAFVNAVVVFTNVAFSLYVIDFLVIFVLEVLIIIVEAKLFKLLINTPKPLKLSIILNALSFAVGDIIFILIISYYNDLNFINRILKKEI